MYLDGSIGHNPEVTVSDDEYERLADVVCASERATPGLTLLWEELDRAVRVAAAERSPDVAALGSRITFVDGRSCERRTVRLALPSDMSRPGDLPVTEELGAALLGLRPGDRFHWRAANGGVRRLRIEAVQPPACDARQP